MWNGVLEVVSPPRCGEWSQVALQMCVGNIIFHDDFRSILVYGLHAIDFICSCYSTL